MTLDPDPHAADCPSRQVLDRDGLVRRTVHATVPVRVDDELSPLGDTLRAPIAALEGWATSHVRAGRRAASRCDG